MPGTNNRYILTDAKVIDLRTGAERDDTIENIEDLYTRDGEAVSFVFLGSANAGDITVDYVYVVNSSVANAIN